MRELYRALNIRAQSKLIKPQISIKHWQTKINQAYYEIQIMLAKRDFHRNKMLQKIDWTLNSHTFSFVVINFGSIVRKKIKMIFKLGASYKEVDANPGDLRI